MTSKSLANVWETLLTNHTYIYTVYVHKNNLQCYQMLMINMLV